MYSSVYSATYVYHEGGRQKNILERVGIDWGVLLIRFSFNNEYFYVQALLNFLLSRGDNMENAKSPSLAEHSGIANHRKTGHDVLSRLVRQVCVLIQRCVC